MALWISWSISLLVLIFVGQKSVRARVFNQLENEVANIQDPFRLYEQVSIYLYLFSLSKTMCTFSKEVLFFVCVFYIKQVAPPLFMVIVV